MRKEVANGCEWVIVGLLAPVMDRASCGTLYTSVFTKDDAENSTKILFHEVLSTLHVLYNFG